MQNQNQNTPWGYLANVDLYECDHDLISNPDSIKDFISKLCSVIDMKAYGPTLIERFGSGSLEGYSAMQFVETSSITAHFDEKIANRAFIDIFSCKYFDAAQAGFFCYKFFKAKGIKMNFVERN